MCFGGVATAFLVSCGVGLVSLGDTGTAHAAPPSCTAPAVTTTTGQFCGLTQQVADFDATRTSLAYLGMRYATAQRFAAPVPATAAGLQQATQIGAACPQNGGSSAVPQSEDCLFVNVWKPATAGARNLPVMLFIHGGAFQQGSSFNAAYLGSRLAAKAKVVVVDFNYRLGAFGFLAGGSGPDAIPANLGLRDQQAAIAWVHDNAAAFGGDPTHVTLFGESAGAMSVGAHLTQPTTAALFRNAILESNPYGIPFKNQTQVDGIRAAIAKTAVVKTCAPATVPGSLACLRSLTTAQLLKAQTSLTTFQLSQLFKGQLGDFLIWSPQVDPDTVPSQPNQAAIGKPVIIGTNRNEGNLFVPATPPINALVYTAVVGRLFGAADAARILTKLRYAVLPTDNAQRLANLINDYLFVCANRAVLKRTTGPAYAYSFTHVPSYAVWPSSPKPCQPVADGGEGRVCHSFELPFVFRNPVAVSTAATPDGLVPPGIAFTTAERSLVNRLTSYWTSFAANDQPTSLTALIPWPKFRASGTRLVLDTTLSTTKDTTLNCPMWDSIGYDLGDADFGIFPAAN